MRHICRAAELKKDVLHCFLDIFQRKIVAQHVLVMALQMLILPMLSQIFQNKQSWDVVDTGIINTIIETDVDPPEEVSTDYDEYLGS